MDSRNVGPGGVPKAPNQKASAHIAGPTGNIRVGGRADNVNTGISLKRYVSGKFQLSGLARNVLPNSRRKRAQEIDSGTMVLLQTVHVSNTLIGIGFTLFSKNIKRNWFCGSGPRF